MFDRARTWFARLFGPRPCERCGRPSAGLFVVPRRMKAGTDATGRPVTDIGVRQVTRLCAACLADANEDPGGYSVA